MVLVLPAGMPTTMSRLVHVPAPSSTSSAGGMTVSSAFCAMALLVLASPYWIHPVSARTSGRSGSSGPKSSVTASGQHIPRRGGGSGTPHGV
jgi:hypothetical protein